MNLKEFSMLEMDPETERRLFESEPARIPDMVHSLNRTDFTGSRYHPGENAEGRPDREDTSDLTEIGPCDLDTDAEEIFIGPAVTRIQGGFWECYEARQFTVSDRNPLFFERDGVLFRRDEWGNTILTAYPPAKPDEAYCVPQDVTGIDPFAFHNTRYLKLLEVTSVRVLDRAFVEMEGLMYAAIENAQVMNECFGDCRSLRGICLPDDLLELDGCFCGCRELKGILKLPEKLLRFHRSFLDSGIEAFFGSSPGCTVSGGVLFSRDMEVLLRYPNARAGNSYAVPDSVIALDDDAFSESGLESITVPDGLKEIRNRAFRDAGNLRNIACTGRLSDVSVGADVFEGTPWLNAQGDFAVFAGTLVLYRGTDAEVRVPPVHTIAKGAFQPRDYPFAVKLTEATKRIGPAAFYGCDTLEHIEMPQVEEIGQEAFGWLAAEEVIIPESCREIGRYAFIRAKTKRFLFKGRQTKLGEECIGVSQRTAPDDMGSGDDPLVICHRGSTAAEYCNYYGIRTMYLEA